MALSQATRRFALGPATWSLRASTAAAMRDATDMDVDMGRLRALCKVEAEQVEEGVRAILAWTRQIKWAGIPADKDAITSPLDFWGYSLRLRRDDDHLEDESPADDILSLSRNREGRWLRLPKSASEL